MFYVNQIENAGFSDGHNTCVNVHTRNFDFTLAFIEFEDEESLSLLVTDENGRERLKLVNKAFIEYIEVVYQGDLDFGENEPSDHGMFV